MSRMFDSTLFLGFDFIVYWYLVPKNMINYIMLYIRLVIIAYYQVRSQYFVS